MRKWLIAFCLLIVPLLLMPRDGAQAQEATPTETPTATATLTATPTLTPTTLAYQATLTSQQTYEVRYTISVGEIDLIVTNLIEIGLLVVLILVIRSKRGG
jgi:hypothetical protein